MSKFLNSSVTVLTDLVVNSSPFIMIFFISSILFSHDKLNNLSASLKVYLSFYFSSNFFKYSMHYSNKIVSPTTFDLSAINFVSLLRVYLSASFLYWSFFLFKISYLFLLRSVGITLSEQKLL